MVESCEQPVALTCKWHQGSMTLRSSSMACNELMLWGQLTEDPGAQMSQVCYSCNW